MASKILVLLGLCAVSLASDKLMEDPKLFEGDMILTAEQKLQLEYGEMNPNIPLAATKTNLWPKVIPYEMDTSISGYSQAVSAINAAIADYEKLTCLRFKKRTTESGGYIHFYRGGGCSSPVGYSTYRANRISLAGGCWYKGIVMHEIAHTLGFYHEQSRPDRDQHVIIRWENIPDNMEYNFRKQRSENIDSMNVPYDYKSVMHYGKTAFGSGRITIQTKDPAMQDVIGRRSGFSDLDVKQMNLLYKCSAPGCSDSSSKCAAFLSKCNDAVLGSCVRKSCPLTCGVCKTGTTSAPVTTAAPPITTKPPTNCKDAYSGCYRYKSNCQKPAGSPWGNWMRKNCRKTCNYCGTASTQPPATTLPLQTTVAKTQPPITSDCSDAYSGCNRYKKNCQEPAGSSWGNWMRKYCRKTCNYCITRPTTVGPTRPQGQCGISSVQAGRVIAGQNAKQGAWPWQILMLLNGRTMCGGSLVAPNWVVTAAHCVSGREGMAGAFKVRVGEHDSRSRDGKEVDIPVSKIIAHPSYRRNTLDFDIALMKLSTPARLATYVNTVCLPKQGQHVPVGTQCFITGWGKIRHPGSMHNILQQAKMPVVSKQACTNLNTRNFGIRITDNMVCAGHGGSTRVSGCHGDSGGPFVCQTGNNGRWELHGAVSWGSGRCDATSSYTVFARVAQLRSWIDQTMSRN